MATVTLKQMRYALALAETRHFGDAAARCHITQPALSQQIRLVEDFCGAPLFDRLGRSARPTPFGGEFLARARQIVQSADALEVFAMTMTGGPARPLRFGLIPTVAPYLLPEIFPALRASLPELRFEVSEGRTDSLLAGLADGNLDIALIATDPPGDGPRLAATPLFADPFVLATSDADDNAEPVKLADLDRNRILLLDEGHCFRDQAIAACGLKTGPGRNSFAATSLSTIVEFVANGQGVTLLPEIALRKETADPRIHIRRLEAPGAGRVLSLVWREATPFAAIFSDIAATIRSARNGQVKPADRAAAPRPAP